jgi:hypothetical protein
VPSVRKEIFDKIARDLHDQARRYDNLVWRKKVEIKVMVQEQKRLKELRAEHHRLYHEFTKGTPKHVT